MMSAVTAVLYVIKDIAAVCAILVIFRYLFLNEVSLKKKVGLPTISALIIFNAFFGVFFLSPRIAESRAVLDLVSNIVYIVSLQVFTDNKRLRKSIWSVLFLAFTVDMLYSLVSPYIGDELYKECIFNIILYFGSAAFIYSTARNLKFNFLPEVFAEIPKWIYAVIMLFDLTCYYKEFGASVGWYNALYIVSSAAVILCALYLVFKIYYMAHQQTDIIKQMEMQKEFGEKTILGDEELRRFRHDYRNHMIVVNAYLESGKTAEAWEYLNTINGGINGVLNKIKTGNFVSDAILNSKAVSAAKFDTQISFSGRVPSEGISSEDLCTILSNLIDNAIEACEKVSGRKKIEIESGEANGFLILSVSNPTVNGANPKFRTTKKDKLNHGIGLKNVERVIKKYNGTLDLGKNGELFTANVRVEMEEEQ